ncbi:LacI family DNA-binding transcriptional regulator [Streptomyces sp. NPDC003832]
MTDMLVAQRHERLLSELRASGGLKVAELAVRLGVSRATVRRDLLDLERDGQLTRVRGGAMLATLDQEDGTTPEPAPRPSAPPTGRALGLLVPSATYYYPRVVAGVQEVAAEHGVRVVIGLADYGQNSDLQRIDELAASGVDGLLVTSPGGHDVPDKTLVQLESTGLPYVLLERQPGDPYASCEFVATDHRQGAFAAVRHFAELGRRNVALFTNGSPTAALVRKGYAAAVDQLDLDPQAPAPDSGSPTLGSAEANRQYDEFIDQCLERGVEAALVHSDHDAIELMRRLRARRLRIPQDMALIAYDDEIASLADVPLTAVAPPKHEIGRQGAKMLVERLAAADPRTVPVRQLLIQPRLIVRSSCGAATKPN